MENNFIYRDNGPFPEDISSEKRVFFGPIQPATPVILEESIIDAANQARVLRRDLSAEIGSSITPLLARLDNDARQRIRENAFHPINPRRNLAESAAKELWNQNHLKVESIIKAAITKGRLDHLNISELFEVLSTWREPGDLDFVGLRPSTACNLDVSDNHRCAYCSQARYNSALSDKTISNITAAASENGKRKNVIYSISGGEMLFIYRKRIPRLLNLIRQMADAGAVVNLNSNLHLLTPEIALELIESGLAKIHVSLDSHEAGLNSQTRGGQDSLNLTMRNLLMMQTLQQELGVEYPVLHINTVVTNKNIYRLPELFAFLLELRRPISDLSQGSTHTSPLRRDLAPHFLFVRDKENKNLFLNKEDIQNYYQSLWPILQQIWENYQNNLGLPDAKKSPLSDLLFFGDPMSRFGFTLEDIQNGVELGQYYPPEKLPLYCYVLGKQAYVMPNGIVYPCGGIAEAHREGVTNDKDLSHQISDGSELREGQGHIIQSGLNTGRNRKECAGCYGSAIEINQRAELLLANALLWLVDNNLQSRGRQTDDDLMSRFENNLHDYLYPWLSS